MKVFFSMPGSGRRVRASACGVRYPLALGAEDKWSLYMEGTNRQPEVLSFSNELLVPPSMEGWVIGFK